MGQADGTGVIASQGVVAVYGPDWRTRENVIEINRFTDWSRAMDPNLDYCASDELEYRINWFGMDPTGRLSAASLPAVGQVPG